MVSIMAMWLWSVTRVYHVYEPLEFKRFTKPTKLLLQLQAPHRLELTSFEN